MPKVVFITGATAGFGEACARLYAKNGWKIVATGRRQERLDALAAELGRENVCTLAFDVRDEEAAKQAIASLPAEFAEVDVLINNAGLALGLGPAHEADMGQWETMIDTNIKGLLYITRALLPGMVERGRGHVVNLGSIAGSWPYPGGNVYGATKAFVQQFSRNLRADLQGKNVRVTNIEPGLAESEFSIVRFSGDKDKADKVYEGCEPLRPEDIADIIFWTTSVPAHVNINSVEVMPTCQSWAALHVHKEN